MSMWYWPDASYISSPLLLTKPHGMRTAIPRLHIRQREFGEDELFTGSYSVPKLILEPESD